MKKLFYLLVVVVFISCGPQQNKNQDILPGRLGSENLALKNDKRLNPQLLSGLSVFGLDSIAPPPPVSVSSSVEERLEFIAASEPLYRGLFAGIYQSIDLPNNVINETRIIKMKTVTKLNFISVNQKILAVNYPVYFIFMVVEWLY